MSKTVSIALTLPTSAVHSTPPPPPRPPRKDARDLPALWTGNLVALMPHKRTLCSTLQPEHYAAENVQSMGIQNERGGGGAMVRGCNLGGSGDG
jgi:hypothetical protein